MSVPVGPRKAASPVDVGPPPHPPQGSEQADGGDPFDQESEPTPWYRKPAMLIAWLVSVVVLIGLIIFGVIELIHGQTGGGISPVGGCSLTPKSPCCVGWLWKSSRGPLDATALIVLTSPANLLMPGPGRHG
ncbi:hypothetical protein [Mycobacterium sp. 1482292.6]|uniref:hypothetical protein n=1 Tax=Mycobacterium sp. 1482292.6 TaxID=1834081 RepID=UPI001E54B2CD|nr:hypothetical protein [Mycobacterium sp. 1482292.6]